MQKVINVIAIASGVVSLTVIGVSGYVYVQRDAILDGVKAKVQEAVMGSLGGFGGTGALEGIGGGAGGAVGDFVHPTTPSASAREAPTPGFGTVQL